MKITSEAAFAKTIDTYGELQGKIEALQDEAKILKTLLELYANETGTNSYRTSRHQFKMDRGSAALKRRNGISEKDVVALLMKSETLSAFVYESYDAEAIKEHAATVDDPEEMLEGVGLYLTEPGRHAKVKPLNKTR